jgi:DNA/RNA endonuclease G (NUC1)
VYGGCGVQPITLASGHPNTPTTTPPHTRDSSDGFGRWANVGLPGGDTTYLFKENFVVCYDARTRNPKWVMERVTRATVMGDADRKVIDVLAAMGGGGEGG